MTSSQIRQQFLDFFKSKQHTIVPSAPMVIKNDPTLMFTNAGMNQFKDIFLGNSPAKDKRVADTQKCLRVSGKHNDLEEVGIDTYHHTMFEMLGNWSFGDYFKKEAIQWAWELLTEVYKIDKTRLYATVFIGDKEEDLPADEESLNLWKELMPASKVCFGSRKDNFWEMGDAGPCGPCSEIHVDLRSDEERKKLDATELINKSDPLVIEIWNLVFIQYNRLSDGKLMSLPAKHVDTGMGFERLCMVMQGKKSNYDTDVFQPLINGIAAIAGKVYGKDEKADIAMRVIADHLRAIVFAIADGQLPSNNKAGYVIRRILRRAVRYGYTFLKLKQPFINELLPLLVKEMSDVFPEIQKQQELIKKVIAEEEFAFLRTLSSGIKRFDEYLATNKGTQSIDCLFAFELYDTYGFPVDLTRLMAKEKGIDIDMIGFEECMNQQKTRSRDAAGVDTGDWIVLKQGVDQTEFVGYDTLEADAEIIKYRKVKAKNNEYYQVVLDRTPFYAESGGQVGDRGYLILKNNEERIYIEDTRKENNLVVHITKKLPNFLLENPNSAIQNPQSAIHAIVDHDKRILTMNNHSATHLMNAALKQVLGVHVEQKGSLVDEEHLRFDFSHFSKLTKDEIARIENIVNTKIRENINIDIHKDVPIEKAFKEYNAVGVFGEKYGDFVRVITFDKNFSVELCGGTHVPATGQIGFFKITSESAIAAGIRRIEAITATKSEEFINEKLNIIDEASALLKNPKDILKGINAIIEENTELQKQLELLKKEKIETIKNQIVSEAENINGINFVARKLSLDTASVKDLAFSLNHSVNNLFAILGNEADGKVNLTLMISERIIKDKSINASNLIRELAKEIQGGGGGQPNFATAGGKNPAGLQSAFDKAKDIISKL